MLTRLINVDRSRMGIGNSSLNYIPQLQISHRYALNAIWLNYALRSFLNLPTWAKQYTTLKVSLTDMLKMLALTRSPGDLTFCLVTSQILEKVRFMPHGHVATAYSTHFTKGPCFCAYHTLLILNARMGWLVPVSVSSFNFLHVVIGTAH